MKKIPLILSVSLLASACAPVAVTPTYTEASEIYEYKVGDEAKFYFEYPQSANISESADGLLVKYGDCSLLIVPDPVEWEDVDEVRMGDMRLQSVFDNEGMPVKYRGLQQGVGVEISANFDICRSLVDKLTSSLSDEPIYYNNEYNFSVKLFQGWDHERMADRIVMKRTITPEKPVEFEAMKEKEQRPFLPYVVEVGILAKENEYEDLSDFVMAEYPGYTVEFVTWGNVYGVKIGDQFEKDSLDHFYFMSENGKYFYEAYLKLWSVHYNQHAETFKGIVSTIETF